MRIYVLDGGGPKDSENILNSFLTKCGEKVFWQIGTDMFSIVSGILLIGEVVFFFRRFFGTVNVPLISD